eukprot:scaffold78250_cov25-Cyclotella_meneghiniana.AAC.2
MKPLRAIPILCIWQTTLAPVAAIRKLQEECNSGSTGMQYCPQLNECIQPWAKTCPIDGLTYEGSTNLTCTEGRCSSNNKCSWTMGSATMASYYFNDLDGAFEVPEGCVLNCTGCELTGSDNEPAILGMPNAASSTTPTGFPTSLVGSDDDEYGCGGGSTGLSWCPELNLCIQSWVESCPINSVTFSSLTNLVCEEGRCSSNTKCSYKSGTADFASYYFDDLNGQFTIPKGCALNCTGCADAQDEVGILASTSFRRLSVDRSSILGFFVVLFQNFI